MNHFASKLGMIKSPEEIRELKGQDLVTLHNELTGKTVKKFADRKVGLERTIKAFTAWGIQQVDGGSTRSDGEGRPFRPGSQKGQVIKLCSIAGGATRAAVLKETGIKDSELNVILRRIEEHNNLTVTKTGEGEAEQIVISGALRTRKAFDYAPKTEQKPHKTGTKRAKVLDMLQTSVGATFSQVQEATGWDDRTAYEGIRLIHTFLGYGLKENPTGEIIAFKA